MELLKCRFEALNTMKKPNDSTLDVCFDKIMSQVFGDKRRLIKYLLTPHHKLDKDQIIKIKDIFNDEFKRLMDAKNEESDDRGMDIDNGRVAPSLTTISEHIQIYMTSFLDFPSIKDLSAVCSSIAPIALNQFLKVDIKICNIHQMDNALQQIVPCDIIESNTKTFRVRRSENVEAFIETKFGIESVNVNAFNYFTMDLIPSNFNQIAADCDRSNTYSMIIGDKTKMNAIETASSYGYEHRLLIIQEFDIREQRLKIKQIVTSNNEITVADIKTIIAKDNVSLFRSMCHDPGGDEIFSVLTDDETTYELEELSEDSAIHFYELTRSSVVYQDDSLTDQELDDINDQLLQKLEPFYADFRDYHCAQQFEREKAGIKYIDFAIKLGKKEFDSREIAKCNKKAYDINPNDALFAYHYVVALMEEDVEETETAKAIIFEKLRLHKQGKMDICDDYLWKFYKVAAEICYMQKNKDMALEYYEKSIGIVEEMLLKESSHWMKKELCDMYRGKVFSYSGSMSDVDYERKGREQYEKIIKIFPNSAFYSLVYSLFLCRTEEAENYEEAIDGIDHALYLINKNRDETSEIDCSLYGCYCAKFECLMKLKEYKKAEEIALELIEIAKRESDDKLLEESYERIIDLYEHDLQDSQNADTYQALLDDM